MHNFCILVFLGLYAKYCFRPKQAAFLQGRIGQKIGCQPHLCDLAFPKEALCEPSNSWQIVSTGPGKPVQLNRFGSRNGTTDF